MRSYNQDLSYKLSEYSLTTLCMKGEDVVFDIHHHEAYEIVFINSGYGKRIIGDKVETYSEGDYILVNSYTPHTWYPCMNEVDIVVIQFKQKLIEQLSKISEFKHIASFFSHMKTYTKLAYPNAITLSILKQIHQTNGLEKVLMFIELLEQMVNSAYQIVDITSFINYNIEQQKRINSILNYIHGNFQTQLKLEEIAFMYNMSVSNLCKLFKKHTAMKFSAYVNLLRIQACCFMLENTDLPISTIAYENGFNNIAYFNRIFLSEMSCSPKLFRAKNSV